LETLVDSVTGFPPKRHSSGGAIWLRTILVGVVLALLVPALALAEPALAEEPAAAEAAAAPAAAEPTPEAPAADQPAPAEPTLSDTSTPSDTTSPAAPPSGAAPASPPTLDEAQPTPAASTPPSASAPVTPSAPTTLEAVPPALPATPDAPRAEAKPVAVTGPDKATDALATSQSASPNRILASGPDARAAAAAAAARRLASRADAAPSAALADHPIQGAGFTSSISLERGDSIAQAPTRREEGPAAFGPETSAGDNPFAVHLEAPGGPAPVGSSLLAVLASYVLPGGGSLPLQSTLFLFVSLAVILAFALAPRPGSGERLVLWGLLRSQAGHRLAVRRPG
jgi:hypothetical protein